MGNSQGLKLDTYGEWMKWTWNDSFKRERTHKGEILVRKLIGLVFSFVLAALPLTGVFAAEDKDCEDFQSREEVMEYWKSKGYSATNDPERLDRDGDGIPCEELPSSGGSDSSSSGSDSGTPNGGDSETGGKLPKTATNLPLNAMLGALIAIAGGALLVARRLA